MEKKNICIVLGQRWNGSAYDKELRSFYHNVADGDYENVATRVRQATKTLDYTIPPDREDSVEDAIRLVEAVRTAHRLRSTGHTVDVRIDHNGHTMSLINKTPTIISLNELVATYEPGCVFRIGGVPIRNIFTQATFIRDNTAYTSVNDYPRMDMLRPFYGRHVATIDVIGADHDFLPMDDIACALNDTIVNDMSDLDDDDKIIMLKSIGPSKNRLTSLQCNHILTGNDVICPVIEACNESNTNTYIFAQQRLNMYHEMRVLVSHNRICSMAGNVEQFCPIDITPHDYGLLPHIDTRVENIRNDGEGVTERPDVAQQLYTFAEKVIDALATEPLCPATYVLDVAMSRTPHGDTPVVVELNNPTMSGFYATDPVTTGWLQDVIIERVLHQPESALSSISLNV